MYTVAETFIRTAISPGLMFIELTEASLHIGRKGTIM
jgi:hypothetical protein